MKKTVSEVLVDILIQAGAKNCYGIVGDTLNYVTEAIYKSEMNWIHMRHEEAGAFAAGAESFVTGNLAVVAGSCGPGSLHFINGIYEAQRNSAPVVLIASQLASASLGTGFPQEVDFMKVYESCSVFCAQVTNSNDAQRIFTQAVQAAVNEKGVAVIILPADISKEEIEVNPMMKVWHSTPVIHPNEADLNKIASYLTSGKKITIYAGIGAKESHDEIVALSDLLNAPVVHTSRAKDFINYDNPNCVGMTGMFGTKGGFEAVKECDVLLLLGCGFAWAQFYPEKAKIIQIDKDAAQLGLRHPIEFGAVGDIQSTLRLLNPLLSQQLKTKPSADFLHQVQESYKKAVLNLDKKAVAEANHPIHPQYLVELIDQHAKPDAFFTADVGTAMVWTVRHLNTNPNRRLLISLKHGTMANAMPQALGLQQSHPKKQVISFSGDGGLTMLLGDLLTAKQQNLPIKVVVLDNGSLDFVELEQKGEGLVNRYTDLANQDLAKMAEGMGFWAQNVTEAKDLESAIETFLAQTGPALLSVKTNLNELIMPPTVEVSQVKNMALYSAKAILNHKSADVLALLKNNF